MTTFRFKHPNEIVDYEWRLNDGLLFKNESNPISLDRSTCKGELLYRFLKFKQVNRFGQSNNSRTHQTEITTRSIIPAMMETLDPMANREDFLRNIRGYGYEWLLEVEETGSEGLTEHITSKDSPSLVNLRQNNGSLNQEDLITAEGNVSVTLNKKKGRYSIKPFVPLALFLIIYSIIVILLYFKGLETDQIRSDLKQLENALVTYDHTAYDQFIKRKGSETLENQTQYTQDLSQLADKLNIKVDKSIDLDSSFMKFNAIKIPVSQYQDNETTVPPATLSQIANLLDKRWQYKQFEPIDLSGDFNEIIKPFENKDAVLSGFKVFRDQLSGAPQYLQCHITISLAQEKEATIVIDPKLVEKKIDQGDYVTYRIYMEVHGYMKDVEGQHFTKWIAHQSLGRSLKDQETVSDALFGVTLKKWLGKLGNKSIQEAQSFISDSMTYSFYSNLSMASAILLLALILIYLLLTTNLNNTKETDLLAKLNYYRNILCLHYAMATLSIIVTGVLLIKSYDFMKGIWWLGCILFLGCVYLGALILKTIVTIIRK